MMRFFLTTILMCFGSTAAAAPITPDEIRQLVLDRKVHQLEQEMIKAQAAFKAGETDAQHLRDLNTVFVTTSPKIREVTDQWLHEYPESAHALMANAWIADKIAWTIRGNSYASNVYRDALSAFEKASNRTADLSKRAYAIDPTYLPASDALIMQAIFRNVAVSPELIVHSVMAKTPNAGTLIRGLIVANKGWGGSYSEGEKMCSVHARKVAEWGEQAFDICMIQMAYFYTGWQPMGAFAERLLRVDHPSILDIRRNVIVKSNFYYPGWYETVSKLDFPKEEWRKDLINYVNSEDFADLSMAIDFDSRFGNYTDLDMVLEKVRPRARANAELVLKYDPYNIDAIHTLLNHEAFETKPDGYRGIRYVASLNSQELNIDLTKRIVMAKPWDPSAWSSLARLFPNTLNSLDELKTRREIEANYIAYSNHRPNLLRNFIETNRYLIEKLEWALAGKSTKGQKWMLEADHVRYFYCPVARAMILYEAACEAQTNAKQSTCKSPIDQVENLRAVVESMKNDSNCVVSKNPSLAELQFTPVNLNVMALKID